MSTDAPTSPDWRRARQATVLAAALAALLTTALFVISPKDIPAISAIATLMLIIFSAAGSRVEIRIGPFMATAEYLPQIAICILNPLVAPIAGIATAFGSYPSQTSRVLNTVTVISSMNAAAVTVVLINQYNADSLIVKSIMGAIAYLCFNALVSSLWAHYIRIAPISETWHFTVASLIASAAICIPIVTLVCYLTINFGTWMLPLLLVPLLVSQYFHGLYQKKVLLTEELLQTNALMARSNLQFAAAMVRALDARDRYTAGHSAAVAVYCRDIAREAGASERTQKLAHLAGLLHDIGKIGVPGNVLNKQAKLDDEEFELMKQHAAIGANILGEVDSYAEIALIVRHHHERIDGRGYPDGIGGEMIPAISRMISVADTYSAMTTDRPYRKGMPTEKALRILGEAAGDQLDEFYTQCFLRVLMRECEAYQRGKLTSFEAEIASHEALAENELLVLEDSGSSTHDNDDAPEVEVGATSDEAGIVIQFPGRRDATGQAA